MGLIDDCRQGRWPRVLATFDPAYLPTFEDKLFIEGPRTARRLTDYYVLLLLAAVIATYGLLSASTATVIGAMIVAPLMGPIMATAAALALGSPRRAFHALRLVAVGAVAVVLLSALLTPVVPRAVISFTNNPELASRVAPGLLDLLVALAAGAAGAYISARPELADAMGGVAIAISLVPPLCVVGIALATGQVAAAVGALVLFVTNFLAILLAGELVFLLLGLGRLAPSPQGARVRRRGFALVALSTLAVSAALGVVSYRVVRNAVEGAIVARVVVAWVGQRPYDLSSATIDGRNVEVVLLGRGGLPPWPSLVTALARALDRPVVVTLRVVPQETVVVPPDSGDGAGR
jgi:uncharacterized hydrophobic protein (TIGR00271 family)